MSYNSTLQANNVDLQTILDTVNALPKASSGGSVETTTVTISTNSNRVWATVYEDGEIKTISEMAPLIGYEIPNAVCGSSLMVRVINAVGSVQGATFVHEIGITDESGQHSWFTCYQVDSAN